MSGGTTWRRGEAREGIFYKQAFSQNYLMGGVPSGSPGLLRDGRFPQSQHPGTPWSIRDMPNQSGGPTWVMGNPIRGTWVTGRGKTLPRWREGTWMGFCTNWGVDSSPGQEKLPENSTEMIRTVVMPTPLLWEVVFMLVTLDRVQGWLCDCGFLHHRDTGLFFVSTTNHTNDYLFFLYIHQKTWRSVIFPIFWTLCVIISDYFVIT